jgi:protein-S-isoprenylcysteine O-methyltransferase Ste14
MHSVNVLLNSLETKIPPLVLLLACAVFMWQLAYWTQGFAVDQAVERAAEQAIGQTIRNGAILILFLGGIFFCAAGIRSFRRAATTVNPLDPGAASRLVCSGIYRISRNPMYVGFTLFLTAWAVYLGSFWSLGVVAMFVIYLTRLQILPEEKALTELFGEKYLCYRSRVRRWL